MYLSSCMVKTGFPTENKAAMKIREITTEINAAKKLCENATGISVTYYIY